jgi:predicted amidophosphoribosyltransferase
MGVSTQTSLIMNNQTFGNLDEPLEKKTIDAGFHLLEQERWIEAAEHFDNVSIDRLRSRSMAVAESYYQAGKHFQAQEQFPRVMACFSRARSLQPDRPLLHERLRLVRELTIEQRRAKDTLGRYREQIGVVGLLRRKEEETSLLATARSRQVINPCMERAFPKLLAVDRVLTVGAYAPRSSGRWTRLIRAYKVTDLDVRLADPLGLVMAEYLWEHPDVLAKIDVLMPVPPDPKKFAQRGFAPTSLLARVVSRHAGVPLREHVILRKASDIDTRHATYEQMRACFYMERGRSWLLKGAHVLLIEDVVTTGKNIQAATELLKQHGVKQVYALALARTEEKSD